MVVKLGSSVSARSVPTVETTTVADIVDDATETAEIYIEPIAVSSTSNLVTTPNVEATEGITLTLAPYEEYNLISTDDESITIDDIGKYLPYLVGGAFILFLIAK